MNESLKATLGIFLISLFSLVLGLVFSVITPIAKQTGFFEGDPAISLNSADSTFPTSSITVVQFTSAAIIAVLQYFVRKNATNIEKVNSWLIFIAFLGLNWTFTNLMKSTAAVLRPDFLTSCKVDPVSFKAFVPETGQSALGRYVYEYSCTIFDRGDYYAMPSGHASLYTFHLFTLFLHFNLYVWPFFVQKYSKRVHLVNSLFFLLNSGLLLLELLVLLSRIRNNKHNWFQLLSGVFIAISMSIASVYVDNSLFEIANPPKIRRELSDDLNTSNQVIETVDRKPF